MSTTGGDPQRRKRGLRLGNEGDKRACLKPKIAASSKWMMSGEPKWPRIPALGLAQALISKLNRFGHS